MLPGPVFFMELLTTSRRPRYFVIRVLYGLALLWFLLQSYLFHGSFNRSQSLQPREVAQLTLTIFSTIVVFQEVVVLAMTPSLVAGVIASEKQRKTLHYLLASRLSSAEIVLGKLAARLLHLAILLAVGLPIMSLLSLLGGVDPVLILLAYLIAFTSGFFLACLSIWVSTTARNTKEAIGTSYCFAALWLFGPVFMRYLGAWFFTGTIYAFIQPVNDWLYQSTPIAILDSSLFGGRGIFTGRGITGFIPFLLLMAALQLGGGLLFALLAVWTLRPTFRAQMSQSSNRFWSPEAWQRRFPRHLSPRREVSDDPVLWKERFTTKGSTGTRLATVVVSVLALGLIAYSTLQFAVPAFQEFSHAGQSASHSDRQSFGMYLRTLTAILGSIAVLSTALLAANSITSEREEDTWISLIATPLGGPDIILAKIIGCMWKARWIATVLGVLWALGLFSGSIHPLGIVFVIVELTIFLWFAAALGTRFSLRSSSSWKSQTLTIATLLFINGGYLFCFCPVFGVGGGGGRGFVILLAGITPMIEGFSLFTPWDSWMSEAAEFATACVIGTIGYGAAAFALTLNTQSEFDSAVDRPRRSFRPAPLPIKRPIDSTGIEFE